MLLLELTTYTEDYVRANTKLISKTGPDVTVCPLVTVPLSGIGCPHAIKELANFDSWVMSANLPRNISLPDSRNALR